jgi:hypothetical protein
MPEIPKHEAATIAPRKGKKQPQQPQPAPPTAPARIDTSGIACALDELAAVVSRYVNRAGSDDHNSLAVFTGPEGSGFHPVLLAFQGETTDRIATALERIADAIAKTAGLNLPSLEFPVDTGE